MPSCDRNGLIFLKGYRVLLAEALEPCIRLAAIAASWLRKDREGMELVLRGRVLGGGAGWRVGRRVQFIGPARRFGFGAGVILYGNTVLNANGSHGRIHIGSHTHVDHFCVLYGQGGLEIGEDVAMAAGVLVYTQSNADSEGGDTPVARQPVRYAPVVIGDACWLGAGVRVLPGIILGRKVHVGAGAVVIRDVPDQTVVAGVPAKPLSRSNSL